MLRVELRQPEPPGITSSHGDLFRAPICFGAAADRVCFSAEEWASPVDTSDAALAPLMEEHARILAQRIPAAGSGFRAQVQKTIASAPPEGGSVEDTARALHCSVRTLQRRLVANGTTFRESPTH